MKKTFAVMMILATGFAAGCMAQSVTFPYDAHFSSNVYLGDAPTVALSSRIPTGTVMHLTGTRVNPASDLMIWGSLLVETNRTITLPYKDAAAAVSNGVIISANGTITLTHFAGAAWHTRMICGTNALNQELGVLKAGDTMSGNLQITKSTPASLYINAIDGAYTGICQIICASAGSEETSTATIRLGGATNSARIGYPYGTIAQGRSQSWSFDGKGIDNVSSLACNSVSSQTSRVTSGVIEMQGALSFRLLSANTNVLYVINGDSTGTVAIAW